MNHVDSLSAPKVSIQHAPKVREYFPNLRFMSRSDKAGFASRLHEICNERDLPRERGRQSALAKIFALTPNAVRKWLNGEGMPELETVIAIAKWADVNTEWLMSGRGPKHGLRVATKDLVMAEALHSLPAAARNQALGLVRYTIERNADLYTSEQLGRYIAAIDQFADEDITSPKSKK